MFEFPVLVVLMVIFAKSAKLIDRKPFGWAILGVFYYMLGRMVFNVTMYGVMAATHTEQAPFFDTFITMSIFQLIAGMACGIVMAFILGEVSGLPIRKMLKRSTL